MRRVWAASLAVLVFPCHAVAHGPCSCSSPRTTLPGSEVRTQTPAYKVVWNPRPADFAGQTTRIEYATGHRPDAPSGVVLSRERPAYPRRPPPGRFRVPVGTPTGLYLVLIFDGSEGGFHTTWDYVHVAGTPAGPLAPLVDALALRRLRVA